MEHTVPLAEHTRDNSINLIGKTQTVVLLHRNAIQAAVIVLMVDTHMQWLLDIHIVMVTQHMLSFAMQTPLTEKLEQTN